MQETDAHVLIDAIVKMRNKRIIIETLEKYLSFPDLNSQKGYFHNQEHSDLIKAITKTQALTEEAKPKKNKIM